MLLRPLLVRLTCCLVSRQQRCACQGQPGPAGASLQLNRHRVVIPLHCSQALLSASSEAKLSPMLSSYFTAAKHCSLHHQVQDCHQVVVSLHCSQALLIASSGALAALTSSRASCGSDGVSLNIFSEGPGAYSMLFSAGVPWSTAECQGLPRHGSPTSVLLIM